MHTLATLSRRSGTDPAILRRTAWPLAGRNALTGSSRGIRSAIARAFAEAGCNIVLSVSKAGLFRRSAAARRKRGA